MFTSEIPRQLAAIFHPIPIRLRSNSNAPMKRFTSHCCVGLALAAVAGLCSPQSAQAQAIVTAVPPVSVGAEYIVSPTALPCPVEYSSMGGVPVLSPEDLLDVVDDPAKIINLTVIVQEKATVIVNGEPTETLGLVRPYIVRNLRVGKQYKFEIEGLFVTEGGAEYYDKETVILIAGEQRQVVLQLHRRKRELPPALPVVPTVPTVPVVPVG